MDPSSEFAPLMRRIRLWQIALGLAGLAYFTLRYGTRGAAGFLLGSAASVLSFYLLERTAFGVAANAARSLLLGLRFFLIGGALYAILQLYEVHTPALAAGVCLSVLAVTLANLYDWFRS